MSPRSSPDIPETTSTTPDGQLPFPRKRKRNVLSCLDCRRRKVKCDHGLPACSRCKQRGVASSCTYEYSPGDEHHHEKDSVMPPAPSEDAPVIRKAPEPVISLQPKRLTDAEIPLAPMSVYLEQRDTIARLENRLKILESVVAHGQTAMPTPSAAPEESQGEISKQQEANFFKGRGFRTQFYGASCPNSILACFPEIRAITKEAHRGSTLARLQSEQKVVEVRYKGNRLPASKHPDVNLVSLVPERTVADQSVRLYLSTFEQTYRVLHLPTFWKDYEIFWNSPQESKPGFVAVLLLILATVRCMSPKEPWSFDRDGSSARTEAILWIQACDTWLQQQSQKHRTLEIYQVMCLRVLAASSNSLKIKQAKLFAEGLLEYFKAAGIHRDPSLLEGRCSTFEKETRRRLWATVMELELQSSLDRGTLSSLSSTPYDCKPPLNINDEDLVVDIVNSPIPKPSDEYTSTSYLHISSKSISLRIALCSMINDPRSCLGYDQVLRYEQQINEELDAIPKWNDHNKHDHNQASALLDLQLRQYLILLHAPFARKSNSSQNRYSRMVCFEASKYILDLHSKLISSENFTLSLLRGDVVHAALTICHNAFLCSANPGNMLFNSILSNFSSTIASAFKLLEERFMRRGRGLDQLWWVIAACSIVQTKLEPELEEEIKLQATERVAELYRKMLAYMETGSSTLQGDMPPLEGGASADGTWVSMYNPNDNGLAEVYDLFDSSDWTLDNLWPLEGVYDPGVLL